MWRSSFRHSGGGSLCPQNHTVFARSYLSLFPNEQLCRCYWCPVNFSSSTCTNTDYHGRWKASFAKLGSLPPALELNTTATRSSSSPSELPRFSSIPVLYVPEAIILRMSINFGEVYQRNQRAVSIITSRNIPHQEPRFRHSDAAEVEQRAIVSRIDPTGPKDVPRG